MRSGWVSSVGPYVGRFEKEVESLLGGGRAVAVVNGTSALHLALLTVGVKPDDEVVVPALSFVATANAVRYCGAHPVFMDVDPATWGLDPVKLRDFFVRECRRRNGRLLNKSTGRRVAAVLPMHTLGHPVDMDPLMEEAARFRLPVVEDACEALGARYKGRRIGRIGDVGCFSFNGNKVITTGGGGMVVTDSAVLAKRVRYLSTQARDDPKEYVHNEIGYNYRLTGLQAALGCAQLERLGEFLRRKARIARRYREAFGRRSDVACMPAAAWAEPTNWLFTVRLLGGARPERLVERLRERGIEARRLWRPLHRLPMYKDNPAYRVEWADRLYAEAVSLPSSTDLSPENQERVIREVSKFLDGKG